jgi:hypothetical protein
LWREVTRVRWRPERRDDLEEFAAMVEDDVDEMNEAVRALAKELDGGSNDDYGNFFDDEDS